MTKALSSVDLHFLVEEFQAFVGSKVDKVYQFGKEEFYLALHTPGAGKGMIYIALPSLILKTTQKLVSGEAPPHFSILLRKYLSASRVKTIRQEGAERILTMTFEGRQGICHLHIELFSSGNIILCKEDGTIVGSLLSKRWSQREIRGGVKYELPEARVDPFTMSEQDYIAVIKDSGKESLVKAIVLGMGTGGTYGEEICKRAGMDKNTPLDRLKDADLKKAFSSFHALLEDKGKARAYFQAGKLKDITPKPFVIYDGMEEKAYPDFNAALDEQLSTMKATERIAQGKHDQDAVLERMRKTIEVQVQHLKELQKSIRENDEKGQRIYEEYAKVVEILKQTKAAVKELGSKELEKKLKGHRIIKALNQKDKTVTVEL